MIIGHNLDALTTGSMTDMLETDLLPDKSPDKRPDKSRYPYQDSFTERTPKRTPNGLKTIGTDKTDFA